MKLFKYFSIIILIILSLYYYINPKYFFISINNFNKLSNTTTSILKQINAPLEINIYTTDYIILNNAHKILNKYQHENKNLKINYYQKILAPEKQLQLGLATLNNILISYKNTTKATDIPEDGISEQLVTDLIYKISTKAENWVLFLTGNGEQNPADESQQGLSQLSNILRAQGFKTVTLDLAQYQAIPDNTALIVLANPKTKALPITMQLLEKYINNGGNLLWLISPQENYKFKDLAYKFGIDFKPGYIWDQNGLSIGSADGTINIITTYPNHPITKTLNTVTVLPKSIALDISKVPITWHAKPLLYTPQKSTLINQNNKESIDDNPKLVIGTSLTKNINNRQEQRILLIGNTDFATNAYLSSYGNLALLLKMFQWLTFEDVLLALPTEKAKDIAFFPNKASSFLTNYLFVIFLPILFLCIAFWRYRTIIRE